jgi:hypothetical protein
MFNRGRRAYLEAHTGDITHGVAGTTEPGDEHLVLPTPTHPHPHQRESEVDMRKSTE